METITNSIKRYLIGVGLVSLLLGGQIAAQTQVARESGSQSLVNDDVSTAST